MTKRDLLEIGVKLLGAYLILQGVQYLPITFQMIFDGAYDQFGLISIVYPLVPVVAYLIGGAVVWRKAAFLASGMKDSEALEIKEASQWNKLDVFHVLLLLGCTYYAFDNLVYVFQMMVDKSFFLRSEIDFRAEYPGSTVSVTVFKVILSVVLLFYSHLLIAILRKKPGA